MLSIRLAQKETDEDEPRRWFFLLSRNELGEISTTLQFYPIVTSQ